VVPAIISTLRGRPNHRRSGTPVHVFRGCPAQIRQWIPPPDFLFILRHPIDRAFSNYLMSVRRGREQLAFVEALESEQTRLQEGGQFARDHFGYMARGRYSTQIITRYRQSFPESRMLFIVLDDLFASGETGRSTLARIAQFLGFKRTVTTGISERENVTSEPRPRIVRDFLYKPHPLKKLIRWLIPSRDFRERIAQIIDESNRRPIAMNMGHPPAHVIDETLKEIQTLEELCGIDLGRWKSRTAEIACLD